MSYLISSKERLGFLCNTQPSRAGSHSHLKGLLKLYGNEKVTKQYKENGCKSLSILLLS